jgi:hypothetical protein
LMTSVERSYEKVPSPSSCILTALFHTVATSWVLLLRRVLRSTEAAPDPLAVLTIIVTELGPQMASQLI